ncbi:MAG: hypothetical protein WDW36_004981 [Sanguina aurantia]
MKSSLASMSQRPVAQGSVLPVSRQVPVVLPISRTLPASATCTGKQSASSLLAAAGRAQHTTCRAGTQSNRGAAKQVAPPRAAGDFNIPRGETAGAAMVLEGVTVQAGDRDLLEEVEWRLMPGQRVGLVGANGAGKSTLLKCLCGTRKVDAGRIFVAPKVEVGYLEQTAVSGSERTVWEEARSRMTALIAAEMAMEFAAAEAERGVPKALDMLQKAQEAFEAAGGYDVDKKIANVLNGLGFRQDQWFKKCSEFSGGWQPDIAAMAVWPGCSMSFAAILMLLTSTVGKPHVIGKMIDGLKLRGDEQVLDVGCGRGLLLLDAARQLPGGRASGLDLWSTRDQSGNAEAATRHNAALANLAERVQIDTGDMPPRHLAAVKWLGKFLRNSSGGVVIVSHDEGLLEDACDGIVEVRGKKLHHYSGSYSNFMDQRTMRANQAASILAKEQEEIARLEDFIARFGAKASKASQAQSRMKMLEKLKDNMADAPAAASALGAGDAKKVTLNLPRSPPCNQEVMILKKASVGWGEPGPDRTPLLTDLDLVVKKGQRILVLGPNGAGKSTLIKSLAGNVDLWTGTRRIGDGVKMAYFSQDLAQDLPLEKTGLDYVMDSARESDKSITMEKCRAALGALGLQGSMPMAKIGVLSGGEKARVALAAFALVPCNVLLLDEASNHLDAQTINVLTGALQKFEGAIVAITHNQSFANSLNATHILRVANGAAVLSANMGLSDADFDHRPVVVEEAESTPAAAAAGTPAAPTSKKGAASSSSKSPVSAAAVAPAAAPTKGGGKKRTPMAHAEQQEYKKLTKEVATLTTQRDALAVKFTALSSSTADFVVLSKASQELGAAVAVLEEKEMRWLELAELAGDI